METLVMTQQKNLMDTEARVLNYLFNCELKNAMSIFTKELNYLKCCPEFMSKFNVSMELFEFAYERLEYCIAAVQEISSPIFMECVCLNEIITNELDNLKSTIEEKGIKLTTEFRNEISISGNPYTLGKCFHHLLNNSLDACNDNNSLNIKTWSEHTTAYIEITDTGIGMTPGQKECMFTPFYSTKKDRRGLGAYIAKSIIENHKGTINVSSMKNNGTTLLITLNTLS